MNRKIFFLIYNACTKNERTKKAAALLSYSAEPFFYFVYALGGLIILLFGRYRLLLKYAVIPFATLVYNTLLRKILRRPRPFVREENVESLTKHKASFSCPSNHAASSAVIALAWYCISPEISLVLLIPAALTGLSRIMTGEHYPFDVMLGWFIGLAAGIIGFVV